MKQDFRLNKKVIEGTKEQGKLNGMNKAADCRAITSGLNMTAISTLIGCDRKTLADWLAAHGAGIKKLWL